MRLTGEKFFTWAVFVCVVLTMGSCTLRKIYCDWKPCEVTQK